MHETGAGPFIQHAVMRSLVARPAAELGTAPEPPVPSNPAATISDIASTSCIPGRQPLGQAAAATSCIAHALTS